MTALQTCEHPHQVVLADETVVCAGCGVVTIPSATWEPPLRDPTTLLREYADPVRKAAADAKRAILAAGMGGPAAAAAQIRDPLPNTAHMRIGAVLRAVRGVGRVKATSVLERNGLGDADRLRDVGPLIREGVAVTVEQRGWRI